jgi:hypothetical protein
MTIEFNRITAILGSGHHQMQDRRTHVERLNYWDEFRNPAHIPGIGTGYADAAPPASKEMRDADDSRKLGQQSPGGDRQPDADHKPD